MLNKVPRPLVWIALFGMPSIAYLLFWIFALIPGVNRSATGFWNAGDSTLSFFAILALLELLGVSLAYAARYRKPLETVGIGTAVFLLAIISNGFGIVAITFAGCACASSR
jgi:hypothetical protein